MQKHFQKLSILFLSLFIIVLECTAQDNQWRYIKDYEGVSVYWRYRQELKDQYISELKFVNNNSFKIEISFKPYFVCANGNEHKESAQMFTLQSGASAAGQWKGLYYYPCGGSQVPRSGGFREMRVSRDDD